MNPVKKIVKIIFEASLAITIFFCIFNCGVQKPHQFYRLPSHFLSDNWIRHTYGSLGLSIEFPIELTETKMNLPEHANQNVAKSEVFRFGEEFGFIVMIQSMLLQSNIKASIEGAINGAITGIRNAPGITDVSYSSKALPISTLTNTLLEGSYFERNMKYDFKYLYIYNQNKFFQVSAGYLSDDNIGRQAAERLIMSVQIDTQFH